MRENIGTKKERVANLYIAKVSRVQLTFLLLAFILNIVGVFIIPMSVMFFAILMGVPVTLIPTLLVNILKRDDPWIKYVNVICACIFIIIMGTALNYHIVILYVFPMLIASFYYEPKLNVFALVMSIIASILAQIIPFTLRITIDDNYMTAYKLVVYGIIPKTLILLFLGYLFITLGKSTNQMVGSLMDAEEQEKMYIHMKKLTEKATDVSVGLLESITILSGVTNKTKQVNHDIAGNTEVVCDGIQKSVEQLNNAEENSSHIYHNLQGLVTESEEIAQLFVNVEMLSDENKNLMRSVTDGMNEVRQRTEISYRAMELLEEKTKKIDSIVGIITEISDQTDLLALNAAIESARAGEHGKGFAVVAEEIRKLSQQTQNTVNDIKVMISEVLEQNEIAVTAMNQTASEQENQKDAIFKAMESAEGVTTATKEMNEKMQLITHNTKDIEASTGQIVDIVNIIAATCQENQNSLDVVNQSLDTSAVSMEELEDIVNRIQDMANELSIVVQS